MSKSLEDPSGICRFLSRIHVFYKRPSKTMPSSVRIFFKACLKSLFDQGLKIQWKNKKAVLLKFNYNYYGC